MSSTTLTKAKVRPVQDPEYAGSVAARADRAKDIRGTSNSVIARAVPIMFAIALLACILSLLPGLSRIAPLVESDYGYQLLAADRLYDGLGPTSLQPIPPIQPWEWSYDWGFLTQWPVGYPTLICAVRCIVGGSTLGAARFVSIVASAVALVGWYLWLCQCAPSGWTRQLVAIVGATAAVPVSLLLNPSTDLIVIAAIPFLMRLAASIPSRDNASTSVSPGKVVQLPTPLLYKEEIGEVLGRSKNHPQSPLGMGGGDAALLGIASGMLFWIRYASVFVPAAIGVYLFWECIRRRVRRITVVVFALSSALPIALLIAVNWAFGSSPSATASLNLGARVTPSFTPAILLQAWSNFTDLGYYAHRPIVPTLFAIWPVAALVIFLAMMGSKRLFQNRTAIAAQQWRTCRQWRPKGVSGIGSKGNRPFAECHEMTRAETRNFNGADFSPLILNACAAGAALIMLVGATAVFGAKFNYVGLERYYLPIRPLYYALFVLPFLAVPSRVIRAVVGVAMLCALNWTVQLDGMRNYQRATAAQAIQSPFGQWVRCLGPNPASLVDWLKDNNHKGLVVASNYHEYLALETGLPTVPIPPDRKAFETWLDRIQRDRGVAELEVLFVIDPDNRWRSYWIPDPNDIVTNLGLGEPIKQFADCEANVYHYHRIVAMSLDRSLEQSPFLCSEPRASARADFQAPINYDRPWDRYTKSKFALSHYSQSFDNQYSGSAGASPSPRRRIANSDLTAC